MEKHIKTARIHRAFAWLYGVVAVLVGVLFVTSADGFTLASTAGEVFIIGLCLLHESLSRGARQGKGWARYGSLIVGTLALPGFPVGTVLGAYLLANAWKPWSAAKA